jgi:hypothetical protein
LAHGAERRGDGIGQLFGPNPAQIAANRCGRGFGILPGIADKRSAIAQLSADSIRIGQDVGLVVRIGRKEDLGDAEFLRALGCVHPIEDRFHFVFADADRAFDLGALQAPPGQLTLDLPAHRLNRRAIRGEQCREPFNGLLVALGNALQRPVDVARLDVDFF